MIRFAPPILLSIALLSISACHPRNQTEQRTAERHGGHGLKRVCADDIAKYCQNEDRKRRCLRQNEDKLSADCKTALEEAIARQRNKNKDKTGSDNTNKSNDDE